MKITTTLKKWMLGLIPAALPSAAFAGYAQCDGLQAVGGSGCGGTGLIDFLRNNIVDGLFFIAGAIAVLIIVIGGIGYIASTGDATRITKAKNTILYAVIGLIVVIIARAIVRFVISGVG